MVNYTGAYSVVLKYACKKKLLDRSTLSELEIVVSTEESDDIYLSDKELSEFAAYKNPNNPYLEFIKDMYILGSYSGLRHSDFSRLTEKNFLENRIRTIQQKVDKSLVATIHPLAKKTIEKYSNGFPYQCPKSTQVFNKLIREVAKDIPCLNVDFAKRITKGTKKITVVKKKYEWVSSRVCRRSFCTNELLAGTSVELIMAMSGHSTYKSFKAYVKASAEEKADAIEKIWEERYKHLTQNDYL